MGKDGELSGREASKRLCYKKKSVQRSVTKRLESQILLQAPWDTFGEVLWSRSGGFFGKWVH